MSIVTFISNMIIPMLIFYIVGLAIMMKKDCYDSFIIGAKEGMKTVISVMPTLLGLMMAVGVLRSSGFLDWLSGFIGFYTEKIGVPACIIPVTIIRMFSASAATGLTLDIFKEYGTDSLEGLMASIIMCTTETVFYSISLYFMSVGIKNTRWTILGAMICTFAGIVASIVFAYLM
ncbi:MAG: spore maturation protein [Lachnospira sp.]|nr:spore maturation protein [Lachnospira sp.]